MIDIPGSEHVPEALLPSRVLFQNLRFAALLLFLYAQLGHKEPG